MRRVVAGVATGLVLGAVVATAAHAMWSESAHLDDGVVTAGDLSVTTQWVPAAPDWSALFPGASTTDATLRVTGGGAGTTLGWRLSIAGTVAADFAPYTSFAAWAGPCGTGTPITAAGYPATGALAPGAVVDVCVRYTLATDAPSALQGRSLSPSILVTANQVGG